MSKYDIFIHFPHKRTNKIAFLIHTRQFYIDIPMEKDSYTISWFLSGFKSQHDWIRQFGQDGMAYNGSPTPSQDILYRT